MQSTNIIKIKSKSRDAKYTTILADSSVQTNGDTSVVIRLQNQWVALVNATLTEYTIPPLFASFRDLLNIDIKHLNWSTKTYDTDLSGYYEFQSAIKGDLNRLMMEYLSSSRTKIPMRVQNRGSDLSAAFDLYNEEFDDFAARHCIATIVNARGPRMDVYWATMTTDTSMRVTRAHDGRLRISFSIKSVEYSLMRECEKREADTITSLCLSDESIAALETI